MGNKTAKSRMERRMGGGGWRPDGLPSKGESWKLLEENLSEKKVRVEGKKKV
jgi:hypothetical protein